MRYVLGVVVVVVMIGCGGEPTPIVPTCETDEPLCPEGMVAFCDGEGAGNLATYVVPLDGTCETVRMSVVVTPTCQADGDVECDFYTPSCVEVASDSDCAAWLAECSAAGAESCYVRAGTDEVVPL